MSIKRWTSSNIKDKPIKVKWRKIISKNGVIIMSKVINIFDYKKEITPKQKRHLTKEERMKIKEELLYDDDRYLDMFFEEDDDLKEM
ncbi:hypothetical protein CF087_22510 [Clostridium botulinum]|uniref:hypothetical protein n=1 Tax=Clostridium botulinum TaxID=1491 RepID=UPI00196A1268|nr:hypothetical protein [Clostridium botulinum]MBN3371789.1 hypothetical protein [Clostridium botulinum]MBN3376601.1 hypothetical protein [Clostridium botulinum]